ncbi:hypothetical protein C816_01772 [Oscillibacter sp. 1-3]|nr:hypothetical protein C816_01772 [Oscillibacter sp. 1-3]
MKQVWSMEAVTAASHSRSEPSWSVMGRKMGNTSIAMPGQPMSMPRMKTMAIMMAKASRLPLPMPRWAMIYSPSRDMNTPVNTAAPRRMQINIGFFGTVRSARTGGNSPARRCFQL